MCILCIICCTSFNATRVRRKGDPEQATWVHYYDPAQSWEGNYKRPSSFEECGKDSGCMAYDRDQDDGVYMLPWVSVGQEQPGPGVATDNASSVSDDMLVALAPESSTHLEHIAGPGCSTTDGFSGHMISAEEMEGCTTCQCLATKDTDWQPAIDDEDYERDRAFPYFLTGLFDGMPNRSDATIEEAYPMRHNMKPLSPDDMVLGDSDYVDSIPFHPSCLEVYKKASFKCTGKVNMFGLVRFHERGDAEVVFEGYRPAMKRADDVGRFTVEDWWIHATGAEYVAANPLFIPGLVRVIAGSTSSTHDIHSSRGAFNLPTETNLVPSPGDLFATLPIQLLLTILSTLPVEEIAHLRLVSRAFRQIPISLWQKLIQRDMPWL